jgi:hypothetical protein
VPALDLSRRADSQSHHPDAGRRLPPSRPTVNHFCRSRIQGPGGPARRFFSCSSDARAIARITANPRRLAKKRDAPPLRIAPRGAVPGPAFAPTPRFPDRVARISAHASSNCGRRAFSCVERLSRNPQSNHHFHPGLHRPSPDRSSTGRPFLARVPTWHVDPSEPPFHTEGAGFFGVLRKCSQSLTM